LTDDPKADQMPDDLSPERPELPEPAPFDASALGHTESHPITPRECTVSAADDDNGTPACDAVAELTVAKEAAVEALATGSSQTEAAAMAGVSREAVNRWANHDATFGAALSAYRAGLVAEQVDRARRIRGRALAVIEDRLGTDASLADAVSVVRVLTPAAEIRSDVDAIPPGAVVVPADGEVWEALRQMRKAGAEAPR
jgi:hypothetical protein